ncbi:MAG TPA: hypothetical protein VMV15_08085 [Candidatus Binataceae bacterium]|nr:hypothetical protein [Candidatus Binataceae bacterium]
MTRLRHALAADSEARFRFGLAVLAILWLFAGAARASNPAADAGHLSDQAFTFLNGISGGHDAGSNALLGPVAGFAGDAQTLANALKRGDNSGAANAMGSLQSDSAAVDAALGAHPDPANASRWAAIKSELASLAAQVKPAAASSGVPPEAASAGPAASAPSAITAPAAGVAESSGSAAGGPQVTIESRSANGDAMRIKGWLAGTNLKSAGIYLGRHKLETLHLDRILGEQRVNFDLKLTGVQPGMVLRVYDHRGQRAEAMLEAPDRVASAGVEVLRGDEPSPGEAAPSIPSLDSGNTAEIPSAVPEHHPRFASGTLAGVQISLVSVNQVSTMPRRYEVVGQISGGGVRRAGIYVDGRLVRSIPISSNAGAFSFDTTFEMLGGAATIRAYGVGGNFVETSVNLGSAGTPLYGATPYVVNPYAYGANPYAYGANPYGYGANPYGYGASPYAYRNPYAAPYGYNNNPYGYASPYGNGYPPPNTPWWQRLLR